MGDAETGPTRRLAAATGVAAALVFLVLFREAAFFGRLPHDVIETNDVSFVGTVYEQAAAQVRAGLVPLWFPEFDCGTPLAAAWMYGLLYPGLALFLWLPLGTAWAWTAALHVGWGAAGMTAFLRRRGCDGAGAVAGAALFAVSEHFVGRTACGHLNLVLPVAWVPWMLLLAGAAARGERRAVPLLALTSAAGLLAGHVQVWIYLAPLVAAFAVAEAWSAPARGPALRRLVGAGALCAGVAAAQIAITAEFLREAAPIGEDPEVVRAVSVPPGVLLAKLLGGFAGPAPGPGDAGDFRHEYRGIAGLWAFGLAAWGFRRGAPRRWLWAAAAALGLVAAMGTRTPLTAWMQDVPPFSLTRAPGRALVLALVAVPVLAAHGVSALAGRATTRIAAAAAAAFLALVAGTPGVASVPSTLHETNWAQRLPAEVRGHRVESPPLYQWSNPERSGVDTLRTPVFVRTRGYADLLSQPSPQIAYWVDLAADLVPQVRAGAPYTPLAEDVPRVEVRPYEAMGRARFFARAEGGVPPAEVLRRLRDGERTLFVDWNDTDPPNPLASGDVKVLEWTPRRIRIEATTTGAGWILVSTKLYPDWWKSLGPVELDGDTVGVARGNLGFPAVRIRKAGRHQLVISTGATPAFVAGAAVSLLALALALLLLVRAPRVSSAA